MIKSVSYEKLAGTTLGNYRLERFIGQSKIGPTFLARTDAANTYLVRFLDRPMSTTPKDHEVYLERFQHRARQIVSLQHPYILPLFDFGVFRSFPYLVSPHIPLRSIRTRIDKNGALNTFTAGRYLDQIATALEYAHEHAVLHGNLSVDSIFIRLDGSLVVADFGVRSLLEQDLPREQLIEWSEECAPEQLLGKPASPATDVYAMGVVLFYLLTGSAVFAGSTPDEIAQQHLYASIPQLNSLRGDLPAGLYSILARALAKDPAQRFNQPGAFANAYHSTVGPTNRMRLPFAVSSTTTVQAYQPPVNGAPMADMQFTERARSNGFAPTEHTAGSPRSTLQSSNPHSLHGFSDDASLSLLESPRPELLRRFQRKYTHRTMLIASLIALVLIASSTIGITLLRQKSTPTSSASGQVIFFANNDPGGQTNALRFTISSLASPPAGAAYDAWIINDSTEQVTALGNLTEKNATWSLTYNGANSNLLTVGDKLEITLEQGAVQAPAGRVILAGAFPVMAFQHVQHLLVSFPETPGKVGMLIGLLQQTRLLNNQAAVLQSVMSSQNTVLIGCVAQDMIDIIEGAHGSHYQPLTSTCISQSVTVTGDGFGLLGKGYVASAEEHASLALSQKDATNAMRQHAALMDIALTNITGWVTTIEQDVLNLRAHPTDLTAIQKITTLADEAYHGVDANGDGQIDAVVGEAGALTAYQQGQLMATLTLAPGA